MQYYLIVDDMIKESKSLRTYTIFVGSMAIITPLLGCLVNYFSSAEVYPLGVLVLAFFAYSFLVAIGIYGYLFCQKYRVLVTKEKIIKHKLFKFTEINLCDISAYNSAKQNKRSELYIYVIFVKGKRIFICTRYKTELDQILNEAIENNKHSATI